MGNRRLLGDGSGVLEACLNRQRTLEWRDQDEAISGAVVGILGQDNLEETSCLGEGCRVNGNGSAEACKTGVTGQAALSVQRLWAKTNRRLG